MSALQTYGPLLIRAGFDICAIHSGAKNPIGEGWQNNPLSEAELPKYNGAGVGLLTGRGPNPIVVIDIDCMWEPGLKEAERLAFEILGFAPQRIGQPPKQALFYRASEADWPKLTSAKYQHPQFLKRQTRDRVSEPFKEKDLFFQIETLGLGQQAILYGIHPVTAKEFEWLDFYGGLAHTSPGDLTVVTQDKIREFIRRWETWMRAQPGISLYAKATSPSPTGRNNLALPMPSSGIDLQAAAEILKALDPWPRDRWMRVGFALHHEFDASPEALDLWIEWSRRWPEWVNESECEYQWSTMRDVKPNIVTWQSINAEYRAAIGRTQEHDNFDTFRQRIEGAKNSVQLLGSIIDQNRYLIGDNVALVNQAADAVVAQLKLLRDEKAATRSQVIKLLTKKSKRSGTSALASTSDEDFIHWDYPTRTPPIFKGWAWSAKSDRFINITNGNEFKKEGFDGLFAQAAQASGFPTASSWCHSLRIIPHADETIYWPGAGHFLVRDGNKYINTWSDREYHPVPEDLDDPLDDLAAGLLQKHLCLICGGWNREANILANCLRLFITKPGKKVRWAPLIVGDQGDGKSFFVELFRYAIGYRNVKVVDNTAIKAAADSGFNSFVGGSQIGIINELKMHGHNRYDIVNALKPIITDDVISVTYKGKDQTNILNFTNWMLFSNYRDCVPLEKTDRRYFVIWSVFPLQSMRVNDPSYFDKLFGVMKEGGVGGMIRWLKTVPWHPEFKVNAYAPMTESKQKMTRMTSDDKLEAIQVLIERSANWAVQSDLLLSTFLREVAAGEGVIIDDVGVNRVLSQLGWVKLGYIHTDSKVKGPAWGKIDMSTKQAEAMLTERFLGKLSDRD
ncbi:MAG: PriCT-2 domain-containing protein [Anaerolineaceae bacterium]|nr:PriCT-2 domain-containing protein [Anaerolineaceae bacterium]